MSLFGSVGWGVSLCVAGGAVGGECGCGPRLRRDGVGKMQVDAEWSRVRELCRVRRGTRLL